MTIHLPADLQASVRRKVESGRYGDEAEVIREALAALDARDRDRLQALRAKIAEGVASHARGEGIAWTPELMDELEREAEAMYRRGEQPDPDVCPYAPGRLYRPCPT
jgi:putative addiction module CopG family antidote